jgi:hypothetical protein
VASYCYVLSYRVLKTDATRVPKWAMLIHGGVLPGMPIQRPGSLSRVAGREWVRQTGDEILSIRWRNDGMVCLLRLVPLKLVAPSL